MRIKLRCPHCGDWFTLNLGIENGEAESRESEEQTEEADDEPARPPARLPRGRLIGAVCVVAVAAIIVWAVAALRSDQRGQTSAPDEVSARPAAAEVEADRGREGLGEPGVTGAAPSADDVASAEAEESGSGGREDEGARGDEAAGGEDETAAGGDAPGAAEGDASPADADVDEADSPSTEAAATGAPAAQVASPQAEPAEAVRPAFERVILELEVVASERCWLRVKADGVVVADATLAPGERRGWRADGLFELDVGAGDALRLFLNGEDLGPAGADARVVEGLRVTKDGIRGR